MKPRSAATWTVARSRTGVITFAIPELREPYFAELTELVVRGAEARGLSVVVQETGGVHEREVAIANGVGTPLSDGLLHVPRALTVADLTRRTAPGPLVLLGEHAEETPFAHVTVDNHAVARAATQHLLDRGCQRPAMIGPREVAPSDAVNRRYAGYLTAVAENGLEPDPDLVEQVSAYSPAEGRRATWTMLDRGTQFDGVVAANDSIAFGVIAALAQRGVRVPDDVQVIGIDGVSAGEFSVPSLTSVAPDTDAMVRTALDLLLRQIEIPLTADQPVAQVIIGFRVLQRASTLTQRGSVDRSVSAGHDRGR